MSTLPSMEWTLLDPALRRDLIREQECGGCFVLSGQPCRTNRGEPIDTFHQSRLDRAVKEFDSARA